MKQYHILFSNFWGSYNIFDLSEEELSKVIDAYNYGKGSIFVKGEKYSFDRLNKIKIFRSKMSFANKNMTAQQLADSKYVSENYGIGTAYVNYKGMQLFGDDITAELVTNDFGELKVQVSEVATSSLGSKEKTSSDFDNFDFAIITALYKDELKFVEPYINYAGEIESDEKKLIRYGSLKADNKINILYASLLNTGMIDAAIVTTDIITRFKPRILFMPGVCGGRDNKSLEMLDIIIPNKIFTFQKGKLTDNGFEGEWEWIDLNDKLIQKIQTSEEEIKNGINFKGSVHYEPMACSTAVIDKTGVIEGIAMSKERKVLGLEMEGYGVARACEIANNGNTKAIIVKSVMDKTQGKDDSHKTDAAKISADFVMKIIESGIL